MNTSQEILSDITVHMKYAKYLPEKQRREVWSELVTRNKDMHIAKFPQLQDEIEHAYSYVYNKKILPSMRSMQFAGKPIQVSPNRIYNCAYMPIDHIDAFSETMFLLLGGTGVGFSVQNHHVEKLPEISKPNPLKKRRFLVGDSIEGWADAVKVLMKSYTGHNSTTPDFDFSDIRQKGAQLVTSGGKAPGPEPLIQCIGKVRDVLERKSNGEKLSAEEVYDIICHIADAVLAGGIRRAALICLFSAKDNSMLEAKSSSIPTEILRKEYKTYTDAEGLKTDDSTIYADILQNGVIYKNVAFRKTGTPSMWDLEQIETTGKAGWWVCNPQRGRSNNSAVLLRHRVSKKFFKEIWKRTEDSNAGEPGIYLTNDKDWGTNPCVEIALRPNQFCNLCEVNASDIESQEDLNNRVKAASFIGTLQASYTDFHYLRDIWKKTTEKDALIGVSMTGIGSGVVVEYDLEQAAKIVVEENARVAKLIGINKAARTTAIKPAGTTSLTLGTSSGIHAWHNDYYIRRIRVGKNEAIYSYLLIYHPELVEDDVFRSHDTAVISIPQKAPDNAILRTESPFDLLERIKIVYQKWVVPGHRKGDNTHNISATVSLKPDEWEEAGEWMWKNRDYYNGLSVLPYSGHTYQQAPFEDITKEEYEKLITQLHEIDLTKVAELTDFTNLSGEAACAGPVGCEVK